MSIFCRFGLPVNFQGMVLLPQKKQVFCDKSETVIGCFILNWLNIRWKSFGSVWMTSTSTWTLLEGNFEKFATLSNCPNFPIPVMWPGERTYQRDWLDLGRFLKLYKHCYGTLYIVFIVMLPRKTKLTANFSGRVLSLCVLQDEYWHGRSTEQCSWQLETSLRFFLSQIFQVSDFALSISRRLQTH